MENICLGCFSTFPKAFDTVNHNILFKKLEFYGIRGMGLNWFQSYLTGRTQYVEYNGVTSCKLNISCGVPQGSILGPLLFLIYINDLSDVSKKVFALLFADDSNIFLSGKNPDELIKCMNVEMVKIVDWLQLNKLSLNLSKTHYIIFQRRRDKLVVSEKLVINNVTISRIEKTKFLGVIIDEYLSFQYHIKYIEGKVSRGIGILYKSRPLLKNETLTTLYNAFIYPYFTYCIEVWGNTYNIYLDPLIKLQKRAVRTIIGCKKYDHTAPIFSQLKLLRLKEIYIYFIQLFMFKYHYNILPSVFNDFFECNNLIHEHLTRQSNLLHVPLSHSNLVSRTARIVGVRCYNYFSKILTWDVSYISYKKELKKHLLENDVMILM